MGSLASPLEGRRGLGGSRRETGHFSDSVHSDVEYVFRPQFLLCVVEKPSMSMFALLHALWLSTYTPSSSPCPKHQQQHNEAIFASSAQMATAVRVSLCNRQSARSKKVMRACPEMQASLVWCFVSLCGAARALSGETDFLGKVFGNSLGGFFGFLRVA